jgi:hypothetical protein
MPRLADIVRRVGQDYLARFGDRVLPSHRQAIRDIVACRSPDLGGHLEACDSCGHRSFSYHSCRNRHCPTCQGDRVQRWINRHLRLLLPCPYYLITVTAPAQLRPLARSNQRTVYDILIREAARAVLDLCANPNWIGGRPAILAVLHTWTRALIFHPHVHLLVSAGGLVFRGHAWRKPANPRFLLPGRVLQARLRTRIRTALRDAGLLSRVPSPVWKNPWVAQVKRLRCGEPALRYLARYLFRVAIADHAIEHADHHRVTFRYVESKTGITRRCSLTPHQFLARFLQHVLPRGFVKVRAYGLWSPACRHLLDDARSLLEARRDALGGRYFVALTPPDPLPPSTPRICPLCGRGKMVILELFPRQRAPP